MEVVCARGVGFGKEFEAIDRVWFIGEGPAAIVAHGIDDRHADDAFEAE